MIRTSKIGTLASDIIARLDLKPHPEGGHYRETFRDACCGASGRAHSTAIYFLLARGERSHWHRIDAVAGFCLVTALLAALVHISIEETVWPETVAQWLAIAALGIGPVGAAFYTWDLGMKRGDIRVLGAASYATPLLSTSFLILAGFAKASANIAIAAVLIAGGGLIAARDLFRKRASV